VEIVISGVLFDYSGTLFRLEPGSWGEGLPLPDDELTRMLTAPTTPSRHLPAELTDAWARRDLDPEMHRRVYVGSLRAAGIDVADALYDRMLAPTSWRPYPDTLAALRRLRAAGIPVAVLSNISWDIQDVFELAGAGSLVDGYVLSFAEGVAKPHPKIFLLACQRIGVAPERVLMIGDSAENDGAAAEIGCATAIVEPLPTAERPDALLAALAAHGL
jgi:HAD superfamily hydrolase (TIGR01509 family)